MDRLVTENVFSDENIAVCVFLELIVVDASRFVLMPNMGSPVLLAGIVGVRRQEILQQVRTFCCLTTNYLTSLTGTLGAESINYFDDSLISCSNFLIITGVSDN